MASATSTVECCGCRRTFEADAAAASAQCPHCGTWNEWDVQATSDLEDAPSNFGRIARKVAAALLLMAAGAAIAWVAFHAKSTTVRSSSCLGAGRSTPTRTGHLDAPRYLDGLREVCGDPLSPGLVTVGGHIHHGLRFDISSANASRLASYPIPSGAAMFSTRIANDDHQSDARWRRIRLLYQVFVDGRRLNGGHAIEGRHIRALHARVAEGSTITLMITEIGGVPGATTADWVDPQFH